MEFQTAAQAKAYILAHDEEARALNRKPLYELVAIEASEIAAAGRHTRIFAGPQRKDELIHSILSVRYPGVADARTVYYNSEAWTAWAGPSL